MQQTTIIRIAAVTGALAVATGAFGAHGLQGLFDQGGISDADLKIFDTAVKYQFYHTFALAATAALYTSLKPRSARMAAIFFVTGICIFCGSLYLLSLSEFLTGTRMAWLGAITPLGGLSFITGWIFLFTGTRHTKKN